MSSDLLQVSGYPLFVFLKRAQPQAHFSCKYPLTHFTLLPENKEPHSGKISRNSIGSNFNLQKSALLSSTD